MSILTPQPLNYISLDHYETLERIFAWPECIGREPDTYEWHIPEWLTEWGKRLGYNERANFREDHHDFTLQL